MKKRASFPISLFMVFIFLAWSGFAQEPDNPHRWEEQISAFEKDDSIDTPQANGIVFTGSSSIRGWRTLKEDYPNLNVLNRGFGGSQIADATFHFDRLITKYKPKQVVLYSGDNDIASGKSPEMVLARFIKFAETMEEKLPEAELLFISIKPSISRWSMYPDMKEANHKIKEYASRHENIKFVDISTPMLGEDGKPRPELFVEDGLHMSPEGYVVWKETLKPFLK